MLYLAKKVIKNEQSSNVGINEYARRRDLYYLTIFNGKHGIVTYDQSL